MTSLQTCPISGLNHSTISNNYLIFTPHHFKAKAKVSYCDLHRQIKITACALLIQEPLIILCVVTALMTCALQLNY